MISVGIIGGAFDPPTIGHEKLAEYSTEYFNEVWIMPCNVHNHGKNMTSQNIRLKMIKAAFKNYPSVKINNFEIEKNIIGGSLIVVKELEKNYPDHKFSFIIGEDNAYSIDKWANYKELIDNYSFTIFKRQGCDLTGPVWWNNSKHKYIDKEIPNISSTQVRNEIKTGHYPYGISYNVWDIVIKNNLYGFKMFQIL